MVRDGESNLEKVFKSMKASNRAGSPRWQSRKKPTGPTQSKMEAKTSMERIAIYPAQILAVVV